MQMVTMMMQLEEAFGKCNLNAHHWLLESSH